METHSSGAGDTAQYMAKLVDEAAERAVLGSMIEDSGCCLLLLDKLQANDFYRSPHQKLFQIIAELIAQRRGVDAITLISTARDRNLLDHIGGEHYLEELSFALPTAHNATHWADIVSEKSACRRMINILRRGIGDILAQQQPSLALLDEVAGRIHKESARSATGVVITPSQGVKDAFAYYEEMASRGAKIRGIPTGLIDYDAIVKGWAKQTLNIVAGRPGMGKSSFAVQCAQRASIDYGVPVVIFSLEMKHTDLYLRMMANERRIRSENIFGGQLSETEMYKFTDAASILTGSGVHVVPSSGWNVYQVRAMARRLQHEIQAKLFVVDYLQRMDMPANETHERQVATAVKAFKDLSVELDAPIILLSQLNRGVENTQDRRPELNHLLASGAIEAEADTITLMYRANYYANLKKDEDSRVDDNDLDLIVAKNRNGASGTATTRWDGRFFRIDNATRRNA